MPAAGLGGESSHCGADKVHHATGVFRVTGGDVAANHFFRGSVKDSGGLARLPIIAAGSFQYETAVAVGIGSVLASGLLEQQCKRVGYRAIRIQKVCKTDRAGAGVPVENACVEARLATEGGVETGRVDAESIGQVRDADGVVAVDVEQALGDSNRLVEIETTGAAAWTRVICSDN